MKKILTHEQETLRNTKQTIVALAFGHMKSQLTGLYDTCIKINEEHEGSAEYAFGIGELYGIYHVMLSDYTVALRAAQEMKAADIAPSETCEHYLVEAKRYLKEAMEAIMMYCELFYDGVPGAEDVTVELKKLIDEEAHHHKTHLIF